MPYILLRKRSDNDLETSEVAGDSLLIGRGVTAEVRFDDHAVELEHARIIFEAGQFALIDLKSITGTYLNGERIDKAFLSNRDLITIGPFVLTVSYAGPSEPLSLEISSIAPAAVKSGVIDAPAVDYAKAYALARAFLNKAFLSVLLILAGVFFLIEFFLAGRTELFRPGAVSSAHALFGVECGRCHVAWRGPSDIACQDCHSGPVHHETQAFTPSCTSCHPEHRGEEIRAIVASENCVQCHSDLKTKAGKAGPSRFAATIVGFSQDHPEFAIGTENSEKRLRLNEETARRADFAKIKLNHELHLKPELKSLKGIFPLSCEDCHMPAMDGRLMQPVTYAAHCKQCHLLVFDDRFPTREVPHESPETVHAYLLSVYAESQSAMVRYPEGVRSFPLLASSDKLNPSIIQNVRKAESHLYEITCTQCHQVTINAGGLADIEKPGIPVIWLAHSRFSHKGHRMLGCTSCHARAPKSKDTTEVLLPGIETCRKCHRQGGQQLFSQTRSAPTDCAVCHTYHDKTKDRDWDGPFTVNPPFDEQIKPGAIFGKKGKQKPARSFEALPEVIE